MRWLSLMGVAAVLGLTGCFDGFLDQSTSGLHNRPIEVPSLSDASIATAARVDQVGRRLLSQNPFLGIEPTFHTFGRTEPEIYHPDANGIFVTDGLVARCQTDEELAAVLATELAKMANERRASDRLRKPDPLRPLADAGALAPGADPTQLGTQAILDRPLEKTPTRSDTQADAREILETAGIDPKALEAVEPLLAEARQHSALADHLGSKSRRPRWSN